MLSKIVMWDYFIPRFFMLILQRRWRSKITRAKLVKIALHFWFDSLGSPPSFFLPSSSLLFSSPLSPFLQHFFARGFAPIKNTPSHRYQKPAKVWQVVFSCGLARSSPRGKFLTKNWPRGDLRAPKVVATRRNTFIDCVEWSPRMIKTKVLHT